MTKATSRRSYLAFGFRQGVTNGKEGMTVDSQRRWGDHTSNHKHVAERKLAAGKLGTVKAHPHDIFLQRGSTSPTVPQLENQCSNTLGGGGRVHFSNSHRWCPQSEDTKTHSDEPFSRLVQVSHKASELRRIWGSFTLGVLKVWCCDRVFSTHLELFKTSWSKSFLGPSRSFQIGNCRVGPGLCVNW